MSQNTSSAVMQQRNEPADSLDDFPTQPWATRALIEHVIRPRVVNASLGAVCWEPACNRGYIARPLKEYFPRVHCSDVMDYGWVGQEHVCDFLFPGSLEAIGGGHVDWIITNPPFRLAEHFVLRAQEIAVRGVAVIVRSAFTEGVGRYARLFGHNPPAIVAQFTERVPMVRGRCDRDASTATAYCWLVWLRGAVDTRFVWIPPCRKQLELQHDYRGAA